MLDSFEKAWRSQNHGKKENVHTEIQTLLAALDRERKQSRTILTICASYTLISLLGTAFLFSRNASPAAEIWPVIAAQVLALLVLSYLVRTRLLRRHPSTASVRDSTAAALNETTSEIWSLKLFGLAMAAIVVLLALAVSALYQAGKMDARAVSSFAPVVIMIVIFNACYLWLKWKRKLRPRRDRLTRIMKDLD